ncbi:MAG: outer membrane beta-barrel protein [Kiritimatiellae bacterium]|jgi:hypothetical protein|nr:outer membrane beta-barrel protein [Kiritimatiellia bacterium]
MKKILLISCVLMTAAAFAKPLPKAVYEVKIATGADLLNTTDMKDIPLEFGLGYNVKKELLVGGFFSYSKKDWDSYFGPNGVWEVGAYSEYSFFVSEHFRPYVSLSLSLLDAQDTEADMVFNFAPGVGAKLFLTDNLSLFAQVDLNIASKDIYDFEREAGPNNDWPTSEGSGENYNVSLAAGLRYLLF